MYQVRTDLALEAKEKFEQDNVEIKGVRLEKREIGKDIHYIRLEIMTENGAKVMNRPRGNYITLEIENPVFGEEEYNEQVTEKLAEVLGEIIELKKEENAILIAGLGNREVTPDALGPEVVDNLFVTRHLIREYGKYALGKDHTNMISALAPGVMAQTGMEADEILRGIIKETKPDLVIVVDALAARSVKRLNCTIQVTDTGINPGSGVGNHRNGLNRQSVGVPVIALGVPTVVDAGTIVNDVLGRECDSPGLKGMFVTPKDIDESVKTMGKIIAESLDLVLGGN